MIHCLASGFGVRDTFGRTIRMQGTLVDITERIEIEARLHQEQEFVRRLVASFPDVIAVMDLDGRLTFVSPRIETCWAIRRRNSSESVVGANSQGRRRGA